MVRSVEGMFRDGKVELTEPAPDVRSSRVIVTFLLPDGTVDLPSRGVTERQAADLRHRLKAFEEDWQRPEMDGYDAI
jgi:hypothetical protein